MGDEEILNACMINKGDNIFSFSERKAEERIEALLSVKSVDVSRRFPSSVKITIIERMPFACIEAMGKYYEADDEGLIINTYDDASSAKSIIISGTSYLFDPQYVVVDWSSNPNLKTMYDVITFFSEKGLTGYISEVRFSEKGCYYIYTNNSNVIKFYSLEAFDSNHEFISNFIVYEKRKIMVEVVAGVDPVYKQIDIN